MAGPGKALVAAGLLLTAAGAALLCGPRLPWLGRLPGDMLIRRDRFTFYPPLATCLVLSLLLSLLFRLFGKK